MCGIVGLSLSEPQDWARPCVAAMAEAIAHRGPDSYGIASSDSGRTVLGFRRLAIRDLDPRADQPMRSASGRSAIVFNGEIYNTAELAPRYCGHIALRTTGDTEVFLEALERHGEAILTELNGMFAAAWLDNTNDALTLVRDRMGKKPLYFYEGDGFLAFASELRALGLFGLEPDPQQVPFYFHFGYFPSPRTFFRRTSQLCPGEVARVRHGRMTARRRYFSLLEWPWGARGLQRAREFRARCGDRPSVEQEAGVLDSLDSALSRSVALRTLSDVPVGAFLSGGVDSSLVAAYLKASGHGDVPTFTVAFRDQRYNEAPAAAALTRHLGLSHTVLPIDEDRLPELVGDFFDCYEQPYADSSGLPSLLLCRAVRQHVTVALSGDGGDEFFAGYQRYDWYRRALFARRFPRMARPLMATLAALADPSRGRRIRRWLSASDDAELYAAIVRCWTVGETATLLPDFPAADQQPVDLVRDVFRRVPADPLSQAACFDACYYIPDDLQVKMDRASMRVALEVRCPLLDMHVARLGAGLPTQAKLARGKKSVLKALLARHVPPQFFERPKQGFGVPLARWLAGPLRDEVRAALFSRTMRECGWLQMPPIDRIWSEFEGGRLHRAGPLWMLFVLARFLERAAASRGGGTAGWSRKRAA